MHLLVVLEDRISDWISKGEILEGYFNPDAAFETVTILGLVADRPDTSALARLCAPARCRYISADIDRRYLALSTAGLRYCLLSRALRRLVEDLGEELPQVIRAYGDGLGAIAASIIAEQTGIPFAVSLHTTPDPLIQSQYLGFKDRFWRHIARSSVLRSLRNADAVIAVYAPIVDYLPADIAAKVQVIPNVVGINEVPAGQQPSTLPLKLIWVSRQMPGRDPRPVIAALCDLPDVELTLVGDGPLHRAAQNMIVANGLADRIHVMPAVENHRLCKMLRDHDVMVVNSGFREIPKSVMEASLCGLPILLNRDPAESTQEYTRIPAIFVDGSSQSYSEAIRDLVQDPKRHMELARQTGELAWQLWNPKTAGSKAADVLRTLEVRGQK